MPARRPRFSRVTFSLLAGLSAVLALGALVASGGQRNAVAARAPLSRAQLSALLGSESSMAANPRGVAGRGVTQAIRSRSQGNSDCGAPYGYLTTQGPWIVEAKDPNCRIRLAGTTWYGMQSTNWTLAGLNFEPYGVILSTIKRLGFNSIRIPFSNQVIEQNSKLLVKHSLLVAQDFPPKLKIHPLQILDKVVAAARDLGLMVILDDHFATARSAKDTRNGAAVHHVARGFATNRDITPWGISRKQWVADWLSLTARYKPYDNVIGFDLWNEPHTQFQRHPWNLHDYLNLGATWGPCSKKLCGSLASHWKPSSDWVSAAELAGNAVLRKNPHLLMFVEGVQLYPDPSLKRKVEPYWWGSILKGVATDPVKFIVSNQLVYSPHEWGPWKCCGLDGEFSRYTTQKSIFKIFDQNWGYILHNKAVQAPIWLGEFNTCNSPQRHTKYAPAVKTPQACVSSPQKGSQGQWFHILIQYLQQHPMIGWSYYPLNATNAIDQASNNSVLGCPWGTTPRKCPDPWNQPRLPALMSALRSIQK